MIAGGNEEMIPEGKGDKIMFILFPERGGGDTWEKEGERVLSGALDLRWMCRRYLREENR